MNITADIAKLINEVLSQIGVEAPSIVGEVIVSFLVFAVSIILGWIVYHFFERYLMRWAEKTKTTLDDEILKSIKKPIYFFIILIGLYYALDVISSLKPYSNTIDLLFSIIEILLAASITTRIINVIVTWYSEQRAKEKLSEHILFVLRNIVKGLVALFAILFLLNAWGVDLSGAVVGLGVGGIVIGFALQSVLADFFSAFSIYFDRPFEIGDFIIVGEYAGTVTRITLKSTRIKLLQGEELILPNKELTSTSIRNFKKMDKRRVVFTFGVTYDTPLEKLKKIPEIIKEIIDPEKLEYVDKLDRVHFIEFGDFSLNFEVVYYLNTKDYTKYRDTQQEINFAIKEAFEKEGIEMAFPTQTIYVHKP